MLKKMKFLVKQLLTDIALLTRLAPLELNAPNTYNIQPHFHDHSNNPFMPL